MADLRGSWSKVLDFVTFLRTEASTIPVIGDGVLGISRISGKRSVMAAPDPDEDISTERLLTLEADTRLIL